MSARPDRFDSLAHTLRAIAHAGFAGASTRRLAAKTGWEVLNDDGIVLNFQLMLDGEPRIVAVETRETGRPPLAFAALAYFDEEPAGVVAMHDAFGEVHAQLAHTIGAPSFTGRQQFEHRSAWDYGYTWWSLPDATLVLVEDEYDIQFGLDLSLWAFPAGTAFAKPISHYWET